MKMKQSERKALRYVKDNKVFKIKKTKLAEYFVVDGITGTWEVRHDIIKDEWSCNCPNIRTNTECCHKIAVRLYLKENDRERREDTRTM